MPFGDYDSFEDCIAKNQDKGDPEAYCATIKKQIEGESMKQVKRDEQGREIIAENVPIVFNANLMEENE